MAPAPAPEQGFQNFSASTPAPNLTIFLFMPSDSGSFWSKFCWLRLRSSYAPN